MENWQFGEVNLFPVC